MAIAPTAVAKPAAMTADTKALLRNDIFNSSRFAALEFQPPPAAANAEDQVHNGDPADPKACGCRLSQLRKTGRSLEIRSSAVRRVAGILPAPARRSQSAPLRDS